MRGDRVELTGPLDDQWTKLTPGDRGTVRFVDSLGTQHVDWDNGGKLGLVPGHDQWRVITDEQ
jgi:hypothetical protein